MQSSGDVVLDVRVLGTVEVTADGTPLGVDRLLERALLVRLALAGGSGVPDDTLARDLWGDEELARPAERLRVLASRLRRTLGESAGALRRTPAGFALRATAADLVAVDDARVRLHAARRTGDTSAAGTAAEEALRHWRGPALADLRSIPYGAAEGERLDANHLELRIDLIAAQLDRGETSAGADLERLVAEHPLNERLVGLLATHLYRDGRQADALARLAALRQALADDLGVDPAPATAELELQLLRQDSRLDPPDRTSRPSEPEPARDILPPLHLPEPAGGFVGRGSERDALLSRLSDPGLVSLIGGPGVGKTRLAREVAAAGQRAGRPLAWIDLATIRTEDRVTAALATAVGVVESGTGDPLPRSMQLLAGALLVIDNAEHVVDQAAELAATLLRNAPGLSVLVTSQRPLRISGEEVYPVGPLSPQASVALFCDRSGAEPGPEVDAICAAVDRLPLGIELAAGLTRTLTIQQLSDRLYDRLRILVGGGRDAGARHTSLRSALDWSHDLLDPPARALLRRLSAFCGGCTLEAAEQVLPGDGLDQAEVAAVLTELVDRCLVTVQTTDGVRRFGLLETVCDYALDRLRDSGEEATVKDRHVEWCRQLTVAAAGYGGSDHTELVAALRAEEANLRAAVNWCLDDGDPAGVLEIVPPSWWYWWSRGLMTEARAWLRRALDASGPMPSVERASGLRAVAALTRNSGDFDDARVLGEEALATYRAVGDEHGITAALLGLCITSVALGELDDGLRYGEESRARAEAAAEDRLRGAALNNTAIALRCLGRSEEAQARFTEALAIWDALDDQRGAAGTITCLAIVARQRHEHARSRELALDSLRRYREIGLVEGQLDSLDALAALEVADGRPEAALRLLTVAARQRARLGAPLFVPDEIADRDAALAAAREALGSGAEQLEREAATLPLEPVVESVLEAGLEAMPATHG